MLSFCKLTYLYRLLRPNRICLQHGRSKHASVRVRFAPSPTGFLHIGGIRTALYNYLFAKQHPNGKFILRIEDTDQTRIVPKAKEYLLSSLQWIGINPDESYENEGRFGPYVQSERIHLYKKFAHQLVKNGFAYHCFCSEQRLLLLKKDQIRRKEHPRYDSRCRELSESVVEEKIASGVSNVIRLKTPSGIQAATDDLYGEVKHDLLSLEGDTVLLKSDGYPTYHLANVVDDHLMNITHVIRGNEWLNSLPKHILIYKGLGWEPPKFIHLPLLTNKDGSKLSKRQGDVFVEQYKEQGYSAAAVLNFIAFYGSGFGDLKSKFPIGVEDTEEILRTLTKSFDFQKIACSPSKVEFTMLKHFSSILTQRKISTNIASTTNEVICLIKAKYPQAFVMQENLSHDEIVNYVTSILENRKGHINTISELFDDKYKFLWIRPKTGFEGLKNKDFFLVIENLICLLEDLGQSTDIRGFLSRQVNAVNLPTTMKQIREVLTGFKHGASLKEILKMLGKKEALIRFRQFIHISSLERKKLEE